jgi:hypothetical protein
MLTVFDLDGTLIDTREAVVMAYREAGVEMPSWAWGLPWRQWLNDQDAHDRKNACYAKMLRRHAHALPLLDYAIDHFSPVITGASCEAVVAVKYIYPGLNVVLTGATRAQKIAWLRTVTPAGLYVDDDDITLQLVSRETTWRTASPQIACSLLSSSPLEPTRG